MYKIKQSFRHITTLGGLNFIFSAFSKSGIPDFISSFLGSRDSRAKYSYSDIIFSLFGNCLGNGEYLSDLQHFKSGYSGQVFHNIPSADTVEYVCRSLKTPDIFIKSASGITHQINRNSALNGLLPALAVKTGLLKPDNKSYTLDYDNVVLQNKKQDSLFSYKKVSGYQPAFAFIGNICVYLENRNGNTSAKFAQKQALEHCFDNLSANGIRACNFRADVASYQKEVIELLEHKVDYFYIRQLNSQDFKIACSGAENWEKTKINYHCKEVSSIEYSPFGADKTYRVVITRTYSKDNQQDLFTGNSYNYQGIITNNRTMSETEVIEFYNARGNDSENSNKNLLNDFNVKRLPFSDFNLNTVYMNLAAVCNNLFEYSKTLLIKNGVKGIKKTSRVKRVFYLYVNIPAKLRNKAREKIIEIFSVKQIYRPLRI